MLLKTNNVIGLRGPLPRPLAFSYISFSLQPPVLRTLRSFRFPLSSVCWEFGRVFDLLLVVFFSFRLRGSASLLACLLILLPYASTLNIAHLPLHIKPILNNPLRAVLPLSTGKPLPFSPSIPPDGRDREQSTSIEAWLDKGRQSVYNGCETFAGQDYK